MTRLMKRYVPPVSHHDVIKVFNAKIVTETILVGEKKEIIAPVAVGDDITDGSIRIFVWQEGNMLPLTEVKEIK